MRAAVLVLFTALLAHPAPARADREEKRSACFRELADLGVRFRRVKRKGVRLAAVLPRGKIAGVEFRPYRDRRLVIDCSLAYSLARVAPLLAEHGVERVVYSSAYDRRRIRGTRRLSSHSFGLAIDVHTFSGPELGEITVRDHYEQGLGSDSDCVGEPLTEAGSILRALHCGFDASGQFRIVLTPDYDAHHYNHFHLEALPWSERGEGSD